MENLKSGENRSKESSPPKKSKRPILIVGVTIVLVILGVVWFVTGRKSAGEKKQGGGAKTNSFPVPVTAGTVRHKDVPIYLDGLGTVQAFNTVTVHVRVDGQLQKVAFTEGQDVKAGDLLAQIDPDPSKRKSTRRKPKSTRMRRN